MPDLVDLLTTAQAAERLGVSPGQVRKLAALGKIAADRRYPKAMRFDAAELDRYDRDLKPGRGRPRKANITKSADEVGELSEMPA